MSLRVERDGAVAVLTLDRPDVLNAFDEALTAALLVAVNDAAVDPSVRCVVITGAGRAFSAGQDLRDRAAALSQGAAGARGAFTDTLDALIDLLGERVRDALHRNDDASAASASKAVDAVLQAQTYANGNVSPQVITAKLIRDLSSTLK